MSEQQTSTDKYPDHPKMYEETYWAIDEETGLFGKFGTESGFCYALVSDIPDE